MSGLRPDDVRSVDSEAMISSRSRVLASIMARVTGGGDQGVVVDKLLSYSSSVAAEETQLKLLKNVLGTQVRTRTI